MKRIVLILFLFCSSFTVLHAQYVISDNYRQWFGEESNVILRKAANCAEDGQDLWNGCHVRLVSRYVYIYEGNNRILYGDKVRLVYNGYWIVSKIGYEYLYTPDGQYTGVYGEEIADYPWNSFAVRKYSDIWYVYNTDGSRLGFYSEGIPLVYRNGCWAARHGDYLYAYDQNGNRISGVYGNDLYLMSDGRWKCTRGSYVTYR